MVGTAGVHNLQGDAIRSLLGGLKSAAFKVEPVVGPDGTPELSLFWRGIWPWGGLSSSGAAGMAEAGATRGRDPHALLFGTTTPAPTTTRQQALLDERYEAVTAAESLGLQLTPPRAPAWKEARKPHHEAAQGDGVSAEGEAQSWAGRCEGTSKKRSAHPRREAKTAGRDQRPWGSIATSLLPLTSW